MSATRGDSERFPRYYCGRCGYNLRSHAAPDAIHRCPECGRAFQPDNPRTYRTDPPSQWRRALYDPLKTVGFLLLIPVVLFTVTWCILYPGWRSEQATVARLKVTVGTEPLFAAGIRGDLGSAGKVLDRVSYVALPPGATDADLAALEPFAHLRNLTLSGSAVTDAGLVHLKGLRGLRTINCSGAAITDVTPLQGLEALESLDLFQSRITDPGLAHLGEFRALTYFRADETRITDAGLGGLHKLTRLTYLNLSFTRVTDAGLGRLRDLKRLRMLWLNGLKITDATLEQIGELPNLWELQLGMTRITDAGLVHLHKLKQLDHLWLNSPYITPAGVGALRAALPRTRIDGITFSTPP